MSTIAQASRPKLPGLTAEEKRVIFASSLGTVFEWYDFYLYGSLAAIIAKQFFSGVNPTAAYIFALLAFAAGFAVRPFGALVFGRLGDLVGRKYTFLVTILIMGFSTFVVGLLPGYAPIGIAAPVILIGAAPAAGTCAGRRIRRRGDLRRRARAARPARRVHRWIQTTATLGLLLSLRRDPGCAAQSWRETFETWGWRIPFLVSLDPAGRLGVDPAAAARVAGVPAHEGRRQGLEGAADRSRSASGRTSRSCCWRCSA